MELDFEWDEEKAATNFEKHDVTFEDATQVFFDKRRLVREDRRREYGENRYQAIGSAFGDLLFVVYTVRGRVYRMISARQANTAERRDYHGNR